MLETFANPSPERDYCIEIRIPEFTCLCPRTGQPDFAVLVLQYVPDSACVELKALKQYVWAYRNQGAFHEAVTNRIVDDLVSRLAPRYLRLTAQFNVRGGLYTTVTAEHRMTDWSAQDPPPGIPARAAP
jgi:7-cyano-7-deazaguanine reductase